MNAEETNNQAPFPQISDALIKELNLRFPEHCAELEWEEKQVWFVSGQRAVVRFLNHHYKQQQENVLRTGD